MTLKDLKEAFRFTCTYDFWKMSLLWSFALLYNYLQLFKPRIFRSKSTPVSTSINPQNGSSRPICVITGPTSGIGKATAFALAEKGFYVLLVGRSSHRLSEQWLSDSELHPSIQLLVNNAGILGASSRPSVEGYDRTMATNYIGPFVLTKLLMPLLKNSSVPSRVVKVSSFTHLCAFRRKFDKDSVTGVPYSRSKPYLCAPPYEFSKLCIQLFSHELHRQLHMTDDTNHISVLAADPGFTITNLMRELPVYIEALAFRGFLAFLGLAHSAEKGAESIIDAALSSPETSGVYYFGGKGRTVQSSKVSRDRKFAKQLWETSSNLFNKLQLKYSTIIND